MRPAKPLPKATAVDIITCEYPPDIGGVADYTRQVAVGLEQCGHMVRVWTRTRRIEDQKAADSVPICGVLGSFGPRHLWRTQMLWAGDTKRRQILLQWSPTGFGYRGMNLLFPVWIAFRVFLGDTLCVMFHEGFYDWNEPKIRHKIVSLVQRFMAAILINAAKNVFVSTPYLAQRISRLRFVRNVNIRHLPVPSNVVPLCAGPVPDGIKSNCSGAARVGHFSTFSPYIIPILIPTLEKLMRKDSRLTVSLIGTGSEIYRAGIAPEFQRRVTATGPCSLTEISAAICPCTFMFQPYPEGLNSRRATAMAALAHGKLLVSTSGRMTEEFWKNAKAVKLLPSLDPSAMAEELSAISTNLGSDQLTLIASEAVTFYERHFSIRNVLATLSNVYRPAI
jgi:glycosyltransferase involved in cell wall biosynthesis